MEKFIGELLSAEGERAEPYSVKDLVTHFCYDVTVRASERMPFLQTRCKRKSSLEVTLTWELKNAVFSWGGIFNEEKAFFNCHVNR